MLKRMFNADAEDVMAVIFFGSGMIVIGCFVVVALLTA